MPIAVSNSTRETPPPAAESPAKSAARLAVVSTADSPTMPPNNFILRTLVPGCDSQTSSHSPDRLTAISWYSEYSYLTNVRIRTNI